MKPSAEVYIGRGSDDIFRIDIRCERSRVRVCEVEMTAEQFALLITGRVTCNVPMRVGTLEYVGKKKIEERRSIVVDQMSKDDAQSFLKEVYNAEDDWIVDPYLGSQRSIVHNGDGTQTLNFTVYKYV